MKLLSKLFVLLVLFGASSCAYFGNDPTVNVAINSNPSGADIYIEGKNYGRTPRVLTLEPKNYEVVLSKEGYGSKKIKLESWQTIRHKKGEGGRCIADALGSMFILPVFSYWSKYCRDFKQPEYYATIPYIGASSSRFVDPSMQRGRSPNQVLDYNYQKNTKSSSHPYGSYYSSPSKGNGEIYSNGNYNQQQNQGYAPQQQAPNGQGGFVAPTSPPGQYPGLPGYEQEIKQAPVKKVAPKNLKFNSILQPLPGGLRAIPSGRNQYSSN